MYANDTIVAPATAPGAAAIAIVRISGPKAWPLVSKLVPAFSLTAAPRLAVTGRLETPDGVRDDALLLPFRGPRSYTGEDLVELHLHGNDLIVSAVLRALVGWGARLAGPGEFTQRAFLHGKLDLTQAEAVGELIGARSARMAGGAAARLAGGLSSKYQHIRQGLLEIMVHLEATIDFPDEDIETLGYPRLLADIDRIQEELRILTLTFEQGRVEREGLRVAIAGRPNAGKSSLMNALLGTERAIVTPHAGTTRDYLEESLALGGAAIQLLDTAGLRDTMDPIEAEGIRRAKEKLGEADVLLYIVDGSLGWEPAEIEAAKVLGESRIVWIVNKADVAPDAKIPGSPAFHVSAKTGAGLPALLTYLSQTAAGLDTDVGVRVVSARQQRLVTHAASSLEATARALRAGEPPELAVSDLRQAVQAAGELTGEIVNDEVLGEIFSRFCIGK